MDSEGAALLRRFQLAMSPAGWLRDTRRGVFYNLRKANVVVCDVYSFDDDLVLVIKIKYSSAEFKIQRQDITNSEIKAIEEIIAGLIMEGRHGPEKHVA